MRNLLLILLFAFSSASAQHRALQICDARTISGVTSVIIGATSQLTDIAPGGSWSSTNTSAATIGSTGLVTGVSTGTSTISYTVSCGRAATVVMSSDFDYATYSPINKSSNVSLSNANLTATGNTGFGMCIATVGKTVAGGGKWYFEFTMTQPNLGVSESFGLSTQVPNSADVTTTCGRVAKSFGPRMDAGNWDYSYNIGAGWVTVGTGTHPIVLNDVVGFAVDMGGATLTMYINNVLTYTWALITSGDTWYPAMVSNSTSNVITATFKPPFAFTPPAGYVGWHQ